MFGNVQLMKRILIFLLSAWVVFSLAAEELPPATQILSAARAQLPPGTIVMSGSLKRHAPNGFVKKHLLLEAELNWSEKAPRAIYRLKDEKTGEEKTLEIIREDGVAQYKTPSKQANESFNPYQEIDGLGISWADLSFSFLWENDAKTIGTGRKIGKSCYKIQINRPNDEKMTLWIEQETGRMLGAETVDSEGWRQTILKVVSVKDFDGIWMVKDLDMVFPVRGGRTSLRIDHIAVKK
jgi:hypothetical protein